MVLPIKSLSYLLFFIFLISCSESNIEEQGNKVNSNYTSTSNTNSSTSNSIKEKNNSDEEDSSECTFEDGTYSAHVEYENSQTNYSETYTLDVHISDCQVIQIDFPKGGYLDNEHISPSELDEYGNATVYGDDTSYTIHIIEN